MYTVCETVLSALLLVTSTLILCRYARIDEEEDDDECMESNFHDVQKEEHRSTIYGECKIGGKEICTRFIF